MSVQLWTEAEMLELLRLRYTAIRRGTNADRWVRAAHVRSRLGSSGVYRERICDFIAGDKYPGIPYGTSLALHGHEVKVSRSDWLRELRAPEKAAEFTKICHYWWIVIPDSGIVAVDELPEGWGLMSIGRGRDSRPALRVRVQARRHDPEPPGLDFTLAFAAAAAKTAGAP